MNDFWNKRLGSDDDYRRDELIKKIVDVIEHMSIEERNKATVYTSGEHCPMCAAAHGWVGLGRIVYASSSKQLVEWLGELGLEPSQARVRNLPIEEVIRDTVVEGPVPELAERVKALHFQLHSSKED